MAHHKTTRLMTQHSSQKACVVLETNVSKALGARGREAAYTISTSFLQAVDGAINSRFFWAYCTMVNILAGFLSSLASWCEGCQCHEDVLTAHETWYKRSKETRHEGSSCTYKGRRAPELASGHLDKHVEWLASSALGDILSGCDGLGGDEQSKLLSDWNSAVDKALFEIQLKTEHWKLLPWSIAVVGHHDIDVARAGLRVCKRMFSTTASFHEILRSF